MTYSLINKCAKNYYNRTFIVQVIAKNVVTCFFLRHSVISTNINSAFHPSGVRKSSIGLSAGVKAGRVHLCRVARGS